MNRVLLASASSGSAAVEAHPIGAPLELDDGESHHLQVRRAVAGEAVEVRDGAGLTGTGRLVRLGKRWAVALETVERAPRPPELVLAVGAGDRDRFAWIVEKATELGVTAVVPLETARTVGVATRLRDGHLDKLRRHALEAVKQCGAAWATTIERPVGLVEFASRRYEGKRWLADQAGTPPPTALASEPIAVVVGPEGGLDQSERAALLAAGYEPVLLGPHTLRFETAALAAAAAIAAARFRGSHG